MAKHNRGGEDAQERGNGLDNTFVLETGAYGIVESHVGSLKIKGQGGTVDVPKESFKEFVGYYTDGGNRYKYAEGKDEGNWRFQGTRFVPFPRASANRDELIANLARFMDDLVAFDAASEFVVPAKDNQRERHGKKGYKLLVNGKGEPISVEQYIYGLVVKGHTLEGNQKPMQNALQDKAEKVLREELAIDQPVGKVRERKVVASNMIEDDEPVDNSI